VNTSADDATEIGLATHTPPKGVRSSSVLIGSRFGARPIARSDAIIPMYQMIHIAPSPQPKPTPLQVPRLELSAPRSVELRPVVLRQMKNRTVCLSGNGRNARPVRDLAHALTGGGHGEARRQHGRKRHPTLDSQSLHFPVSA
jgi:hypothetical protein